MKHIFIIIAMLIPCIILGICAYTCFLNNDPIILFILPLMAIIVICIFSYLYELIVKQLKRK